MIITPRVIDISHHNTVKDLKAAAAAGIWGVIHKASQGAFFRDADYARHRAMATDAGLLWGAYHFNDGDDVAAQVDNFLKAAQPDDNTLLVLDYEDNPQSDMSIDHAVQFLRLVESKVGRKAAIYSGNRIKQYIGQLNDADRAYVLSHRLWLCQYGPKAVLPKGFSKWWLWQYTDGVVNVAAGSPVPGIEGKLDCNAYNGTHEQLISEWR